MEKGVEASGLSRKSRVKPFLAATVTLLVVAVAVCAVVAVFSSANTAAAASPLSESGEALEVRSLVDEPQPEDSEVLQNFTTLV